MGFFEDTIIGQVVKVECVPFSKIQIKLGIPKEVTLIQIRDEKGEIHCGYILGKTNAINTGRKIVCTLKKTWNNYYVQHIKQYGTFGTTFEGPGVVVSTMGNVIYRKIGQYQIVR